MLSKDNNERDIAKIKLFLCVSAMLEHRG